MAPVDVPEPWASAMLKAQIGNPRNGRPSWRALAAAVGVHPSTITAMVAGSRKRDPELVARVAKELRVKPELVSQWLELPTRVRGPYEPPSESRYLTDPERDAITGLIKAITTDRLEGGGEHDRSAPTKDAPSRRVTPMPTRRTLPGADEVRAARKKRDPE